MRLKDFVKSLKDYEWVIKKDAIRSDTNDKRVNCCPLTVKFNETEDMYGECAAKLGIPDCLYASIAEAADNTVEQLKLLNKAYFRTDSTNLIALRRLLLKELGLKEEEKND